MCLTNQTGLAWSVLLSTMIRVITVVKMLWNHEAHILMGQFKFQARQPYAR